MAGAPAAALFLGRALSLRGVDSAPWSGIPNDVQLADYDVVILDLTAWVGGGDRLPELRDIARIVMRVGACVVVVGHPKTVVNAAGAYHAAHLLPAFPRVTDASGTRTQRKRDDFPLYLDEHVAGYAYLVEPAITDVADSTSKAFVNVAAPGQDVSVRCLVEAITATVGGEPAAMRLTIDLVRKKQNAFGPAGTVAARSTSVAWLPPPTRPDVERTWQALLTDLGVLTSIEAPAWASAYRTPDHDLALAAASEARRRLEQAQAEAAAKEAAEQHESRFTKLLYEEGDVLEEIVWEALELLGGTVQRPTKRDGDDGRLLVGDRRAVLEIKGRKGFVKKDDLQQLAHWVVVASSEDDSPNPWKGILVANAHNKAPPSERGEAYTGAPCQKVVDLTGLAVLTTTHIFEALCQRQRGSFDLAVFWEAVLSAVGLVKWP